ncbi:MAG: DNA-formamidopyrimidine glycosylase [Candidatus Izemoplasmatales bacterium]|jgi:formamidopyrimidine-DNA glycosylase|nr:DNA-formamidopyrimidine glycosylase [Candidatus Izemoplasmatales bacterium]MDD3865876.1 DNA-formamidopyrimidine glycosylase [Candidatus Izemoplasmatales bacterium]
MPELPEVETIRATLQLAIVGKTIAHIDIYYDKIIHGISPTDFQKHLVNQKIHDMDRYGKYLFFILDDYTIISHLRMEGKYYLKPETAPVEKHEHIVFVFTDHTSMRYHDTRKFGTMELVTIGNEKQSKSLASLGLEPFNENFTVAYLQDKIKKSIRPVKSFLLDQTIVCGLGNIYVNEILWRCKLNPETKVRHLSISDLSCLIDSCRVVLKQAIEAGGTTIRTYYSSLGVAGRFQNELKVHEKKGQPCPICHTPIEKIKVGGRGTFYCPSCQKKRKDI